MSPKLLLVYLDHDVHKRLARELRRRDYDAVAAVEVGMEAAEDEDQLAYASSQGRALVTFNTRHFVPLHKSYLTEGHRHAGIIVSPQYPIGETLRRIVNLLQTLSAKDMENRLEYLSSWG